MAERINRRKTEPKRLLILASKLGYQTRSFAQAAEALGVETVFGTDRCGRLDDPWQDGALPLRFEHPRKAAEQIAHAARSKPIAGLVALGDRPTVAAAYAARALGLAYSSPEAVENCRSKLRQREVLRRAGVAVPEFFAMGLEEPVERVLPRVRFPCVVKPLVLAASQGVIRANNPEEFVWAVKRIRALIESPEVRVTHEPELDRLLVERYIPGGEVAVEGLLERGRLRVLAVFDKPDPLEGPFFEETIYVTPSRLAPVVQQEIIACANRAIEALGLSHGPLHAEFRINEAGPWVLELQPRPIGGLCARALRFGPKRISLEELLIRHALGLEGAELEREPEAAGVMMVPVPESGVYEGVEGLEEAAGTPSVTAVEITARLHDHVTAWPEGSSYLGFIFARASRPELVEAALRAAHAKLRFRFVERLPAAHPATGRIPARTEFLAKS
jgi:biotin carboxylase